MSVMNNQGDSGNEGTLVACPMIPMKSARAPVASSEPQLMSWLIIK